MQETHADDLKIRLMYCVNDTLDSLTYFFLFASVLLLTVLRFSRYNYFSDNAITPVMNEGVIIFLATFFVYCYNPVPEI